ncbi:hypothetical protein IW261DRAFT_1502152 [Armillaria novae-zelandiae]|uniref:Secreted protein n=1 Tax=Armillaria novae-zelandiae TaxID=153914 RepID=A0AA39NY67_9AGAR|nr:hypothetical protein IW261DRAFT_1502152 [Armillaria novae-zelandiae]
MYVCTFLLGIEFLLTQFFLGASPSRCAININCDGDVFVSVTRQTRLSDCFNDVKLYIRVLRLFRIYIPDGLFK